MNGSRRLLTVLCSAVTLAVSPCSTTLVPHLDLPRLTDASDLIVVGRVTTVQRDGETVVYLQGQALAASSWSAEVEVERTLKGKIAGSEVRFNFPVPRAPVGYRGADVGQFGVFFLRQAENAYQILDPYHPFLVAAPAAPHTEGTPLDQVTAEVAHVFDWPGATGQSRREAVEVLRTLDTPPATAALKTAARDPDPGPRVLAVAALLERGDMAWLDPAASILLSHEQGVDPYLVWRLATAIEASVKDPRAIPTLVRLLHAPEVPVRRAAAAALRNTRDPAAIGPLTEALDDSDREVRYQGVIGLAEITGADSEWSPAYGTFANNEGRYLTYWRDWTKSRK